MMMTDPQRLVDVAVVARLVGVTSRTVRYWIAAERLPASRTLGGHYRVLGAEVDRLLKKVGKDGKDGN